MPELLGGRADGAFISTNPDAFKWLTSWSCVTRAITASVSGTRDRPLLQREGQSLGDFVCRGRGEGERVGQLRTIPDIVEPTKARSVCPPLSRGWRNPIEALAKPALSRRTRRRPQLIEIIVGAQGLEPRARMAM
jgi:hypothetical protein